jgi:hypothetical protein
MAPRIIGTWPTSFYTRGNTDMTTPAPKSLWKMYTLFILELMAYYSWKG